MRNNVCPHVQLCEIICIACDSSSLRHRLTQNFNHIVSNYHAQNVGTVLGFSAEHFMQIRSVITSYIQYRKII